MNFESKPMRQLATQKAVATRKRNNQEKKLVSFFRKFYVLAIVTLITGNAIIGYYSSLQDFTLSVSHVEAKTLPIAPQQATEAPVSVQDYVFTEVERALGRSEAIKAMRIIACESNFRPDIITIEPNKTVSAGIWQINSIHKDISNADKLDYQKATKWSIEKVKREGNWGAWTCGKNLK